MLKKLLFIVLFGFVSFVCVFAQNIDSNNINPWEEIVNRTFSATIPDTSKTYTIEVRFSPYGNEAYVTYVILDSLYRESDAVYAVRDVARKLTEEFGYDWYNYASPAVLRFDNVNHLARYRANIIFRRYLIQEDN
ncbi:MAG: hypothetical protein GX297_08865 [Treponema sp.]|nr:hypothetical protein [Treponema sp.]